MNVDAVQKVGIVGSGTMGREIGFQIALAGIEVLVYDLQQKSLDNLKGNLGRRAEMQAAGAAISTQEQIESALDRISTTSQIDDLADVDLISESVFEDLSVKKQVWGKVGKICSEKTLFTTNTSSLAPSAYAEATGRPEMFAAMHFHLPIEANRIVDVMTNGRTSQQTMDMVQGFVERINMIPIRIDQESPGYLFNSMLIAYLKEAIRLLSNDIGSRDDIDKVWTTIMGVTAGPFRAIDFVGVDTVWRVIEAAAQEDDNPDTKKSAAMLKKMVDEGKLGVKSGKGFYDYVP